MDEPKIHPHVRVGHVHLRVGDLDRAVSFYQEVLGFQLTGDGRAVGVPAVFLAAGDYHHHLGLNTFDGAGATPPPPGHTGLYHFALLYPDREALAAAARRVLEAGHEIQAAIDHGATISLYLNDPDGNGIELYYDRPRDAWYDAQGRPVIQADSFPLEALLEAPIPGEEDAEAAPGPGA